MIERRTKLSRFERGGDKKTEIKSVLGEKLESMNYKGFASYLKRRSGKTS